MAVQRPADHAEPECLGCKQRAVNAATAKAEMRLAAPPHAAPYMHHLGAGRPSRQSPAPTGLQRAAHGHGPSAKPHAMLTPFITA